MGLIAYVALLVRALVAAARRRTALRQAEIALARGDDAAVARLGSNERRRGADVELLLAQRAERATDFATALACAEVGLRKSNRSPAAQAGTYDVTAPGLAGMRALALAALGRAEESDAALAAMPNGACYPFAPTARLRTRLAQLLARGDRRGALELARNNAHVPLPTRDSLVVDLLEATDGEGADDPERARLRTALSDPVLAKWVEHFLPGTDPSAAKARVPPPAEAAVELPDHAEAVEQR